MLWISQNGLRAAHLSALKAEIERRILKLSDTRSFTREKDVNILKGKLMLIKVEK